MDFHARQYDPQIGRFLGIDPLADAYGQQIFSTYSAMGNAPTHKIDPNGTNARDMIIPASAGADDMNDFGGQLASKNDAILRDMFKFLGDVYGEGPGGGPAPGNGGRQGIILNPMGGYSFNGSPWLNVASIYSTAHISVEQSHESKSEQNYLIVESPSGNFINIPTGWLSNQVVLATLASLGVTYEADANIYVQQFIGGKPTVLITANDAVVANIQQQNGGHGNWYDGVLNYSKGFAENVISSVTLTVTGAVMPVINQFSVIANEGFHSGSAWYQESKVSWAVPYKFTFKDKFIRQDQMMGQTLSWEDGKEVI